MDNQNPTPPVSQTPPVSPQNPAQPSQTPPPPAPSPAGQPPQSATPPPPPAPQGTEKKKPSQSMLFVAIVAVVIVAVVGILVAQSFMGKGTQMTKQEEAVIPTPTAISTPTPVVTTDEQLDKDSEEIDTNLNNLNGEITETDQSLNDQPTDLSQ